MDDRVVDMVEGGFDVSIRIRSAMPDSALVARKVGTHAAADLRRTRLS
jgi:DNA-binding transcriptional LysR family regulator